MLEIFYIPRVEIDMKLAVQKIFFRNVAPQQLAFIPLECIYPLTSAGRAQHLNNLITGFWILKF